MRRRSSVPVGAASGILFSIKNALGMNNEVIQQEESSPDKKISEEESKLGERGISMKNIQMLKAHLDSVKKKSDASEGKINKAQNYLKTALDKLVKRKTQKLGLPTEDQKIWLIDPYNVFKFQWDFFMTLVLLYSCITIPV